MYRVVELKNPKFPHRLLGLVGIVSCCLLAAAGAAADGGVTFTDVTEEIGIRYERVPSAHHEAMIAFQEASLEQPLTLEDLPGLPARVYGLPGVAVLDYDRDGDLDLYVTNGPGAANSLFANQLVETGLLRFVDRAVEAGVDATDQDGTGVCYGDLDNDRDPDLIVLGRSEPNRLFENLGTGRFRQVVASGIEGGDLSSSSCAVGDVNGDGLLDVVVGNSFDFTNLMPILVEPFAGNQHNQLFVNRGALAFEDVSATSGIEALTGFSPPADGAPSITWAVAVIDVDADGDQDVLFGDDQGGIPTLQYGGLDRGLIHVLINDGSGRFTDRPVTLGPQSSGSWMGFAFGDLDCDRHLDVFGSNFGDYDMPVLGLPYALGDQASRWLLGNGDGTFRDPGVGEMISSLFGWGSAAFDYDNDGDLDILYHGGLYMDFVMLTDNPGIILQNQGCSASFKWDSTAIKKDHRGRIVQGVAMGDLDRDGFVDVVSAANADVPPGTFYVPSPAQYGSEFDPYANFVPIFDPTPEGMVWNGIVFDRGSLSVELNSGGNGNGGIVVETVGAVGLTAGGRVNRDGVGAAVTLTSSSGEVLAVTVAGGTGYLSQHAPETYFGIGTAVSGTLEVTWPGGVRNRLYDVAPGERVTLPEIPCSYDADWSGFGRYRSCVARALKDLRKAGVITAAERNRCFASAIRAYIEG